ncbi:MAG: T9SS type A sorting domain-containing protein [Saprospiraceae bacterium]|nr:T9SS type A sorting domain-containing protein [Saprospiraceae bacterium]
MLHIETNRFTCLVLGLAFFYANSISAQSNNPITFSGLPTQIQTVECGEPTPIPFVEANSLCPGNVALTFDEWTSREPGSCVNEYIIWREWKATDVCGNVAVYTAKIKVKDTTPPLLELMPPDIIGDCAEAISFEAPIPVDACGNGMITYFHVVTDCEPGKVIVRRTWVAKDECLNSASAVQTAVAIDHEPPRPMDVPADVTVLAGDPIPPLPAVQPWGCDLCFPEFETTMNFKEISSPEQVLRIWTFCDCAGNCAADTQVIKIIGNYPPVFDGIPSGPLTNAGLSCFEFNFFVDNVRAFDPPNYDEVPVTKSIQVSYDPCGDLYVATVTFIATDNHGLSAITTLPIQVSEPFCIPQSYCAPTSLNSSEAWVQKFKLGNFSKSSAASGYSDFTSTVFEVVAGSTVPVEITPGFASGALPLNFSLWIDLNRDGVFDDLDERVDAGVSNGVISSTIHVPLGAVTGLIRLRLIMSDVFPNNACDVVTQGETEDYSLRIIGAACMPDICIPSYNQLTQLWEYISRVRLGSMNNFSSAARYSNFRSMTPVPVKKGQNYTLTTNASTKIAFTSSRYWDVYADFNRDGDFNDPAELLGSQTVQVSQSTFNFMVPADAVPGITTLRVVLSRNPNSNACGLISFGEIEDYALFVEPETVDSSLAKGLSDDRANKELAGTTLHQGIVTPNPTTGITSYRFMNEKDQYLTILVTGADGRFLEDLSGNFTEGVHELQVDFTYLPAGLYWIIVQGDGLLTSKKFIKTSQ